MISNLPMPIVPVQVVESDLANKLVLAPRSDHKMVGFPGADRASPTLDSFSRACLPIRRLESPHSPVGKHPSIGALVRQLLRSQNQALGR